uniref:EGF-like domain-containing protein n=1 Tax=Glossina pallidipes TaxID=7398 RepID=A0A1A9ZCQ4_GLOPL
MWTKINYAVKAVTTNTPTAGVNKSCSINADCSVMERCSTENICLDICRYECAESKVCVAKEHRIVNCICSSGFIGNQTHRCISKIDEKTLETTLTVIDFNLTTDQQQITPSYATDSPMQDRKVSFDRTELTEQPISPQSTMTTEKFSEEIEEIAETTISFSSLSSHDLDKMITVPSSTVTSGALETEFSKQTPTVDSKAATEKVSGEIEDKTTTGLYATSIPEEEASTIIFTSTIIPLKTTSIPSEQSLRPEATKTTGKLFKKTEPTTLRAYDFSTPEAAKTELSTKSPTPETSTTTEHLSKESEYHTPTTTDIIITPRSTAETDASTYDNQIITTTRFTSTEQEATISTTIQPFDVTSTNAPEDLVKESQTTEDSYEMEISLSAKVITEMPSTTLKGELMFETPKKTEISETTESKVHIPNTVTISRIPYDTTTTMGRLETEIKLPTTLTIAGETEGPEHSTKLQFEYSSPTSENPSMTSERKVDVMETSVTSGPSEETTRLPFEIANASITPEAEVSITTEKIPSSEVSSTSEATELPFVSKITSATPEEIKSTTLGKEISTFSQNFSAQRSSVEGKATTISETSAETTDKMSTTFINLKTPFATSETFGITKQTYVPEVTTPATFERDTIATSLTTSNATAVSEEAFRGTIPANNGKKVINITSESPMATTLSSDIKEIKDITLSPFETTKTFYKTSEEKFETSESPKTPATGTSYLKTETRTDARETTITIPGGITSSTNFEIGTEGDVTTIKVGLEAIPQEVSKIGTVRTFSIPEVSTTHEPITVFTTTGETAETMTTRKKPLEVTTPYYVTKQTEDAPRSGGTTPAIGTEFVQYEKTLAEKTTMKEFSSTPKYEMPATTTEKDVKSQPVEVPELAKTTVMSGITRAETSTESKQVATLSSFIEETTKAITYLTSLTSTQTVPVSFMESTTITSFTKHTETTTEAGLFHKAAAEKDVVKEPGATTLATFNATETESYQQESVETTQAGSETEMPFVTSLTELHKPTEKSDLTTLRTNFFTSAETTEGDIKLLETTAKISKGKEVTKFSSITEPSKETYIPSELSKTEITTTFPPEEKSTEFPEKHKTTLPTITTESEQLHVTSETLEGEMSTITLGESSGTGGSTTAQIPSPSGESSKDKSVTTTFPKGTTNVPMIESQSATETGSQTEMPFATSLTELHKPTEKSDLTTLRTNFFTSAETTEGDIKLLETTTNISKGKTILEIITQAPLIISTEKILKFETTSPPLESVTTKDFIEQTAKEIVYGTPKTLKPFDLDETSTKTIKELITTTNSVATAQTEFYVTQPTDFTKTFVVDDSLSPDTVSVATTVASTIQQSSVPIFKTTKRISDITRPPEAKTRSTLYETSITDEQKLRETTMGTERSLPETTASLEGHLMTTTIPTATSMIKETTMKPPTVSRDEKTTVAITGLTEGPTILTTEASITKTTKGTLQTTTLKTSKEKEVITPKYTHKPTVTTVDTTIKYSNTSGLQDEESKESTQSYFTSLMPTSASTIPDGTFDGITETNLFDTSEGISERNTTTPKMSKSTTSYKSDIPQETAPTGEPTEAITTIKFSTTSADEETETSTVPPIFVPASTTGIPYSKTRITDVAPELSTKKTEILFTISTATTNEPAPLDHKIKFRPTSTPKAKKPSTEHHESTTRTSEDASTKTYQFPTKLFDEHTTSVSMEELSADLSINTGASISTTQTPITPHKYAEPLEITPTEQTKTDFKISATEITEAVDGKRSKAATEEATYSGTVTQAIFKAKDGYEMFTNDSTMLSLPTDRTAPQQYTTFEGRTEASTIEPAKQEIETTTASVSVSETTTASDEDITSEIERIQQSTSPQIPTFMTIPTEHTTQQVKEYRKLSTDATITSSVQTSSSATTQYESIDERKKLTKVTSTSETTIGGLGEPISETEAETIEISTLPVYFSLTTGRKEFTGGIFTTLASTEIAKLFNGTGQKPTITDIYTTPITPTLSIEESSESSIKIMEENFTTNVVDSVTTTTLSTRPAVTTLSTERGKSTDALEITSSPPVILEITTDLPEVVSTEMEEPMSAESQRSTIPPRPTEPRQTTAEIIKQFADISKPMDSETSTRSSQIIFEKRKTTIKDAAEEGTTRVFEDSTQFQQPTTVQFDKKSYITFETKFFGKTTGIPYLTVTPFMKEMTDYSTTEHSKIEESSSNVKEEEQTTNIKIQKSTTLKPTATKTIFPDKEITTVTIDTPTSAHISSGATPEKGTEQTPTKEDKVPSSDSKEIGGLYQDSVGVVMEKSTESYITTLEGGTTATSAKLSSDITQPILSVQIFTDTTTYPSKIFTMPKSRTEIMSTSTEMGTKTPPSTSSFVTTEFIDRTGDTTKVPKGLPLSTPQSTASLGDIVESTSKTPIVFSTAQEQTEETETERTTEATTRTKVITSEFPYTTTALLPETTQKASDVSDAAIFYSSVAFGTEKETTTMESSVTDVTFPKEEKTTLTEISESSTPTEELTEAEGTTFSTTTPYKLARTTEAPKEVMKFSSITEPSTETYILSELSKTEITTTFPTEEKSTEFPEKHKTTLPTITTESEQLYVTSETLEGEMPTITLRETLGTGGSTTAQIPSPSGESSKDKSVTTTSPKGITNVPMIKTQSATESDKLYSTILADENKKERSTVSTTKNLAATVPSITTTEIQPFYTTRTTFQKKNVTFPATRYTSISDAVTLQSVFSSSMTDFSDAATIKKWKTTTPRVEFVTLPPTTILPSLNYTESKPTILPKATTRRFDLTSLMTVMTEKPAMFATTTKLTARTDLCCIDNNDCQDDETCIGRRCKRPCDHYDKLCNRYKPKYTMCHTVNHTAMCYCQNTQQKSLTTNICRVIAGN